MSAKNLLHRRPSLVAHDLRSAGQVAVLRGVRNRIAHTVQAAFINQIDDQLHFVDALEVRNLRLIARFDQSFKTFLHQRRESAAQHGLLAE